MRLYAVKGLDVEGTESIAAEANTELAEGPVQYGIDGSLTSVSAAFTTIPSENWIERGN